MKTVIYLTDAETRRMLDKVTETRGCLCVCVCAHVCACKVVCVKVMMEVGGPVCVWELQGVIVSHHEFGELSVCQYVTVCDRMSVRKWEVYGVEIALMELDEVHNSRTSPQRED